MGVQYDQTAAVIRLWLDHCLVRITLIVGTKKSELSDASKTRIGRVVLGCLPHTRHRSAAFVARR
jgi:hypothetical protein